MNYDEAARKGGEASIREADRFFAGTSAVHVTLKKVAASLDRLQIPYAVCGAMALNAYGYRRCTIDVDVLISAESLARVMCELPPLGYETARVNGLLDMETTVRVDFHVGDVESGEVVGGVRYVTLAALLDTKLQLGAKLVWLKHWGDVQEFIKRVGVSREISSQMSPPSRAKFEEFWDLIATVPRELW